MIMTVQTTTQKYDVTVLPSTNIQVCKPGFTGPADCKSGYYTTTDIIKGDRVLVAISQRGKEYRAQTITILK
jgi:mRNA-degrading endonuclease HigB of HigAB toxin-antitoxin module